MVATKPPRPRTAWRGVTEDRELVLQRVSPLSAILRGMPSFDPRQDVLERDDHRGGVEARGAQSRCDELHDQGPGVVPAGSQRETAMVGGDPVEAVPLLVVGEREASDATLVVIESRQDLGGQIGHQPVRSGSPVSSQPPYGHWWTR